MKLTPPALLLAVRHLLHSTMNVQHFKRKKERIPALLSNQATQTLYVRSPFSCSSWQSMQYGDQGTAASRFSPMVAPQFVHVP